ncbi:hypothetical protein M011DRAFT_481297 [Sporormia fimetaria CBS 119925]|uniref:ABM domain-containing protein n=1 Tax=Sporormia fimetaria CBS 119925 TaxID=1340428 RepID=A0A6A6V0U6_9PLEO|nr:hypothetical protein M011DRAFT_481297 [Sporormia fimetaria CBS 119925]
MTDPRPQMAQYAAHLATYTPAQNKPVTEIVIFKLKDAQSAEAMDYFEKQIIANNRHGKGIRRQSWGFSASDPHTLVWQLDWEKIQDHWEYWQTDGFLPLIAAIDKLFVEGRPLVRHYEFKPEGMLGEEVQRVAVWNEGDEKAKEEGERKLREMTKEGGKAVSKKDGYAVDMDETSWRCLVKGYQSLEDAKRDDVAGPEGCENHVVKFKSDDGK